MRLVLRTSHRSKSAFTSLLNLYELMRRWLETCNYDTTVMPGICATTVGAHCALQITSLPSSATRCQNALIWEWFYWSENVEFSYDIAKARGASSSSAGAGNRAR